MITWVLLGSEMNQIREEDLEERILDLLRKEKMSTIVLAGKAGIGKTWMARKRVRELENDDNEVVANNILEEEDLEALKNKILTRLSQGSILLILDDDCQKKTKDEIVIKDMLQFLSGNSFKVLITTVNEDGRHKTDGEKIILDLKDIHHRGFGGTAKLGLTNVFANSYEWHGIGEVAQTDGMIKTPVTHRKVEKHSTLLLDGNCLGREELENFLVSGEELQILGLFCSGVEYLPKLLSVMKFSVYLC
ncbi:hypothetical protein ACH5RR_028432 [Cinchona calisaya]|uniref:NB-ARC domain-containing protein n=1 Tax=Cinchona calisaya TaxID=153742 RepID=A0ABD2YNR8_9GENT